MYAIEERKSRKYFRAHLRDVFLLKYFHKAWKRDFNGEFRFPCTLTGSRRIRGARTLSKAWNKNKKIYERRK